MLINYAYHPRRFRRVRSKSRGICRIGSSCRWFVSWHFRKPPEESWPIRRQKWTVNSTVNPVAKKMETPEHTSCILEFKQNSNGLVRLRRCWTRYLHVSVLPLPLSPIFENCNFKIWLILKFNVMFVWTWYENALRLLSSNHFTETLLGRGVDVRRQFVAHILRRLVTVRDFFAVYRYRFQRIHGN